jgi:CHAT domain-containing protein/tetratricopeptide (TPR) repeat protein
MFLQHLRLFGVVVVLCGWPTARPAAQPAADIDELIARGTHFASPQVRRADAAIPFLQQALSLSGARHDLTRGATAAAQLGSAYRATHQVKAALAVLERGTVMARAAARPDLEGLCLRTIANIHIEAGEYDAGSEYLDRTLAIAARSDDTPLTIATLNALSVSARHQGRLTDALEHARAALRLVDAELAAGRPLDSQPQFAVPFNVGKALADGGDYAAALDYFERAFASAQAGNLIAGVWHALFDTAEWYHNQGDLDRASIYYHRALEQSRKAESRDMEAHTIRGLASIAEGRDDLQEAAAGYTAALAVYEQAGFGAWVPSALAALARVQRKLGLNDAESTLARALARAGAEGQPLDIVRVRIEMAAAAWGRNDLSAAERHFDEARKIAADNGLRPAEAVAASGLARVVHARGEAERALTLYRRAEDTIRHLRARIPAPDQRTMFSDAVHATFAGEVQLLMDLAQRYPTGGYDRLAFLTLERERSQDLARVLLDSRINRGDHLPPALRERQAHVGNRLSEIQRELMRDDLPPNRRRLLRAQQYDTEREWDGILAAHPSSLDDRADAATDELTQLRDALAPGEAFVAYTPGWAFVVTSGGLRTVTLPPLEGLEARIDFFVRLLASEDSARAVVAGRLLSTALVQPVQAGLPDAISRLIVSATGALAGLPFAALPDPGVPVAKPLLARYEISYAASASVVNALRRTAVASRSLGLLAIANAPAPVSRAQLATASMSGAGSLGALPYAQGEAERASNRAPGGSRMLTGPLATEYEIKRLALSEFSVLHFATHAVLDPIAPMRSAILLGSGHGEDGLLQAREIFELPLSADLVVLSACRTAAGRVSSAEGMQSLARAFMYAGARSVLGTLRDVDDRATARLMDRFYESAARGATAAEALREAQLTIAGTDPYATAPQWAGFILAGDATVRIAMRRPTPYPSLPAISGIVAAGAVLGTLALLIARRHRRRCDSLTAL